MSDKPVVVVGRKLPAAVEARGMVVTNTPDVLSDATAETAMLCMLGVAYP